MDEYTYSQLVSSATALPSGIMRDRLVELQMSHKSSPIPLKPLLGRLYHQPHHTASTTELSKTEYERTNVQVEHLEFQTKEVDAEISRLKQLHYEFHRSVCADTNARLAAAIHQLSENLHLETRAISSQLRILCDEMSLLQMDTLREMRNNRLQVVAKNLRNTIDNLYKAEEIFRNRIREMNRYRLAASMFALSIYIICIGDCTHSRISSQ